MSNNYYDMINFRGGNCSEYGLFSCFFRFFIVIEVCMVFNLCYNKVIIFGVFFNENIFGLSSIVSKVLNIIVVEVMLMI